MGAATGTTAAWNFPRPLTQFVGRERELSLGRELLASAAVPLVTLTGPGGVGKTRLAIRLADEVASEFPDGGWFVPLASVGSPDLVAPAVASTLGVTERASTSLREFPRDWPISLSTQHHGSFPCSSIGQESRSSSARGLRHRKWPPYVPVHTWL
jgi:hypothetical protein